MIPVECWGSPKGHRVFRRGPHGVSLHGASRGPRGGPVGVPWGSFGAVGCVSHRGGPTAGRSAGVPQVQCRLCGSAHIPVGLWDSRGVSVSPGGSLGIPARSPGAPTGVCVSPRSAGGNGPPRRYAFPPPAEGDGAAGAEQTRGRAARPEVPCHVAAPGSGGRRAAMSSGGGNGAAAVGTETEAGDGFGSDSGSGSERRVHIMVEYW